MSAGQPGNMRDTQPYMPTGSQGFDIGSPPPRQFPWGCVLGGCLGTSLVVLLLIGGAAYFAWGVFQNQLAQYTSQTPVELPTSEISDEEITAVNDRLQTFREQFETGEAPQELVITVDEINALIANNNELKDHVYVEIVEGDLRADVSFPADFIPGGKGRYFNGSATLHVELENGVLIATVVDAEANGRPIPESVMEEFRSQNLAKGFYDDPEMARTLQRCESLEIQTDRIVLKVRQKPASQSDASSDQNDHAGSAQPPSPPTGDNQE